MSNECYEIKSFRQEFGGRGTDRLDEVMQGAGFDARLSRTIEREMWEKWVLLATVVGIICLMRGNVGDIASAVASDRTR